SCPLVRKIDGKHDIDLSHIPGPGLAGRVTKQDVMAFLEKQAAAAPAAPTPPPATPSATSAVPLPKAAPTPAPAPIPGEIVPMTQIRKIIAQRMIESRRTSAHVHTLLELDVT